MIKSFPKSRICVIDVYPSFEKGLSQARHFASKHNIPLNSLDGRKLVTTFCLNEIQTTYKNTQSTFPKVLCISDKLTNKKIDHFVKNYFNKVLEKTAMPYCGQHNINSPDLEFAAEKILRRK